MNPWEWLVKGLVGLVGMMRQAKDAGYKLTPEVRELAQRYLDEIRKLIEE